MLLIPGDYVAVIYVPAVGGRFVWVVDQNAIFSIAHVEVSKGDAECAAHENPFNLRIQAVI